MPLVFHDRLAAVDRDPQVLADRLAQHYSLLDFGPRLGWERRFLHRSSSAVVGDLILTCGYTSPIQGTIGERRDVASINICFGGCSTYGVDGMPLQITPEQPVFFSPGLEYCYSVDHFNGMAFDLDLRRIRATAAAMAGLGVSEHRFSEDLDRAMVFSADDQRTAGLLALLRREFALLDERDPAVCSAIQHLHLDDVIYRTLVLLLFPRLDRLLMAGASAADGPLRRQVLEELLDWLQANLHQSLTLTQLEQRSGYSRRTLQKAFQQRYGCGPMQWIRRQRLEQARQALLSPASEQGMGAVAAVAARYGFTSPSAFSRDFRAHFGLTPSSVLREGRRFRP